MKTEVYICDYCFTNTDKPISLIVGKETHDFCSDQCKRKFFESMGVEAMIQALKEANDVRSETLEEFNKMKERVSRLESRVADLESKQPNAFFYPMYIPPNHNVIDTQKTDWSEPVVTCNEPVETDCAFG